MTIARHVNFNSDYVFIFRGGTCGSFVKLIWNYYRYIDQQCNLYINEVTGDAHNPNLPIHYHNIGDILKLKKTDPNIRIVLITFEDDDIELISKMGYFKHTKKWLANTNNLEFAMKEWPEIAEGIKNPATREITWMQHYSTGSKRWINDIEINQADVIIDFKTIYGKTSKDLNKIIAEYFGVEHLQEVDEYINKYRLLNYRLYGK